MMKRLLACLTLLAVLTLPAMAQNASTVTITVNGTPIQFDQPPVERDGRVYVPLRGVFEHLGASVVYDNGQINATRESTTVQLRIGSTTALVNGQQQTLDTPPFLIGARTLVPLRFVAQSLGAVVNYSSSDRTVTITQPNAAPNMVVTPVPNGPPPPPPPPPAPSITLVRIVPAPDTTVDGTRPQLSATFPQAVRPDSVVVRLDDRTITSGSYISARGFVFNPSYDLPAGRHRVEIDGRYADGRRFSTEWTFATRSVRQPNYLRDLSPPNGSQAGFRFVVRGVTRPGSHVHIVATSNTSVGFLSVRSSDAIVDVVANDDGSFAGRLVVPQEGQVIDVRIDSRAPNGTEASATLRLRP
ncbi:MAG: copper amine oxidase N-terminal domain-containing protein [Vulcanimicrobiaceae bacterium]